LAERAFNPAEVQGNILRGYRYERVRHLILEVQDAALARQWLGRTVSGGSDAPQITSEEQWTVKPVSCFNIGLTYNGLRGLGVARASLASFPTEFKAGMSARSMKLGDTGSSAPDHWAPPFDDRHKVHLIASINADEIAELDRVEQQVVAAGASKAFTLHGVRDGWNFDGDKIHFGYRDSISQPRFIGIDYPASFADGQPAVPIGSMLIGYPTEYQGLLYNVPQPDVLGRNGAFNAFRILAQDVAAFESYLDTAADELLAHRLSTELLPNGAEKSFGEKVSRHTAMREIVAAKMCGRWFNGVPLASSPDFPIPASNISLTNFDYSDDDATGCPFGAHIRRSNPREGSIVQRAARHTRRLVRRGTPYGGSFDRNNPDSEERGLLGNFICASLGGQFEALMCDWVNLGLQDPQITGSNDPLLGANEPETSWFVIPLKTGHVIKLHGFPRFVTARGGAYTFLPGIPAIRYLASL
jgi:deferrochelatase/peroxidase EfeB